MTIDGARVSDQYQRQYIHDLVAGAALDAMAATAMLAALRAMELVHQAGVVIDGGEYAVDFSMEILKLKEALQAMGVDYFDGLSQ